MFKYKRILRKIPFDVRLIAVILLSLAIGYIITYIPPENIVFVILFTILVTTWFYLVSAYFVQKKFQYIVAVSTFLFLVINFIVGFEIINNLLLLSFIIGLVVVIK